MKRTSRYHGTANFAADPLGRTGFRGTLPRRIGPATGVVHHTVKDGQRLDYLSLDYFKDDRRWWRIADANRAVMNGADLLLAEDDPAGDGSLGRSGMLGRQFVVPRKEE
ncbi:MAG: hypothetical protein AAF441_08680 [Pseudomonadota bacterium]